MTGNYSALMKLWADIEAGAEDHPCVTEVFDVCQVCERALEARSQLGYRLMTIMELLEKYHDRLEELTTAVIQETIIPRPPRLQESMLLARALLDKS